MFFTVQEDKMTFSCGINCNIQLRVCPHYFSMVAYSGYVLFRFTKYFPKVLSFSGYACMYYIVNNQSCKLVMCCCLITLLILISLLCLSCWLVFCSVAVSSYILTGAIYVFVYSNTCVPIRLESKEISCVALFLFNGYIILIQ